MCTARFLTRIGRDHGGERHFNQVVLFQRFHARGIEHLAFVGDKRALIALGHFQYFAHAFGHAVGEAEHTTVRLHGAAHFGADIAHALTGNG